MNVAIRRDLPNKSSVLLVEAIDIARPDQHFATDNGCRAVDVTFGFNDPAPRTGRSVDGVKRSFVITEINRIGSHGWRGLEARRVSQRVCIPCRPINPQPTSGPLLETNQLTRQARHINLTANNRRRPPDRPAQRRLPQRHQLLRQRRNSNSGLSQIMPERSPT